MPEQVDHLILKFLSGTATPEEQQQLELWASQAPENKKMLLDFKRIWESDRSVTPDFKTSEEWLKLESKLNQEEVAVVHSLPGRRLFFKVAASIILIAVCGIMLYRVAFSVDSIVMQSGNEKRKVELPDGSVAWLNAQSQITYPEDFNDKRDIELSGEAFFEVAHDPDRPFVITTQQATIQVLGTSFNVMAYERDSVEEVYVATGRVRFFSGNNRLELKPGQLGTLDKNNSTLAVSTQQDENHMAWKTGKLIFRKTRMTDVVSALEQYFRISIIIKNPDLEKCRFTSSFTNPTLEEVIEAISISMDLNIVHQNNDYVFDGEGCGNDEP